MLRRIFGPKRDEIMGDWRTLCSEEHHNLYSGPNIIRMVKSKRMQCAGHLACMGAKRNAYRILMGKPERKRPVAISRCGWEDNIKILEKWDVVVWTGLIWLRVGTSGRLL
jgi:hypothetical protein